MKATQKGLFRIFVYAVICSLLVSSCKSTDRKPADTGPEALKAADLKAVMIIDNQEKNSVDIYIDAEVFTSYLYPDDMEKPVLFPVLTAKGTAITRGYPLLRI